MLLLWRWVIYECRWSCWEILKGMKLRIKSSASKMIDFCAASFLSADVIMRCVEWALNSKATENKITFNGLAFRVLQSCPSSWPRKTRRGGYEAQLSTGSGSSIQLLLMFGEFTEGKSELGLPGKTPLLLDYQPSRSKAPANRTPSGECGLRPVITASQPFGIGPIHY